MHDPIDDIIRNASAPGPQKKLRPQPRTRTAVALLIGLAACLIGIPIVLALTGDTTDLLLGIATGDPSAFTGGDR